MLLGENNLDLAASLSNLGMVNHCQKRYRNAEPLLSQALGIFKQIYFGRESSRCSQLSEQISKSLLFP